MNKKQQDHGRITMRASETAKDVERVKKVRKKTGKYKKGNRILVVLGVTLVLVLFFSVAVFVTAVNNKYVLSYMLELSRSHINDFFLFVTGRGAHNGIQFTTWRYLMIVLAGSCLAASGAVYQGAFRNMLASPSTLGVQAGGNVGNIVYVLMFVSVSETFTVIRASDLQKQFQEMNLFQRNLQQFCVMLGCFAAVFLVVGITLMLGRGKIHSSHLILTGMVFGSIISSFSGIVTYYLIMKDSDDPRIDAIRQLSMGSFQNAFTLSQLLIMAAFLIPCIIILLLIAQPLDILALGDEEARTMGLNVRVFKNVVIALNTVMTAIVIAFCGQVGFIGFMIPLAARRLVGPGFRRLLPASMLMGATLLIIIYDIARWFNLTAYMNVLTSALGSAVMIYSLIRGGGVRRAD